MVTQDIPLFLPSEPVRPRHVLRLAKVPQPRTCPSLRQTCSPVADPPGRHCWGSLAFAGTERKCEEGGEDGHICPSMVIVLPALRMGLKMLVCRDSECKTATAPKDSFSVLFEAGKGDSLVRMALVPTCAEQMR